jgi:hypothetical protein
MPHDFFTIEQWRPARRGAPARWTPILHLDADQSVTLAAQALQKRGKPGLYRVVQMQRCLWAEIANCQLRLHGSHASTPKNLAELTKIFHREHGRRPVAKSRQDRAQTKVRRVNTTPNRKP